MEAADTLNTEHNAVLHVLDQLERAGAAAADGQPVPRDVFADIQEFVQVFVDRCHHAKEETILFPRLAGHSLVEALQQEHERGRALARAYVDAVAAYVPGDRAGGALLSSAASAYAAALRAHIARETAELLPAIQAGLAAQDAQLVEEFERVETERIGAGTHERLHGMIETLAGRIEHYAAPAARG